MLQNSAPLHVFFVSVSLLEYLYLVDKEVSFSERENTGINLKQDYFNEKKLTTKSNSKKVYINIYSKEQKIWKCINKRNFVRKTFIIT